MDGCPCGAESWGALARRVLEAPTDKPCARHLRLNKHFAAGTVCDYVMDALAYLTWFSLFSPDRQDITNVDLVQLDHVSKILQKELRKQVNVAPLQYFVLLTDSISLQERIHISQKTMDTVVANRLLPEGSPDEQWDILRSTAISCIDRTIKSPPTTVTQQHYEWVLGLILACLYVFSPQGRSQAVASLLMSQLADGYLL